MFKYKKYIFILLASLFVFSCNMNPSNKKDTDKTKYNLSYNNNYIDNTIVINIDNYLATLRTASTMLNFYGITQDKTNFGRNDYGEAFKQLVDKQGYLIIKVLYESENKLPVILVMNKKNMHIEGYIVRNQYYIFTDSEIKEIDFESTHLVGKYLSIDGKYLEKGVLVNQHTIWVSHDFLSQRILSDNPKYYHTCIAYLTVEALKFFTVKTDVQSILSDKNRFTIFEPTYNAVLKNWEEWSKEAYSFNFTNAKKYISILDSKK